MLATEAQYKEREQHEAGQPADHDGGDGASRTLPSATEPTGRTRTATTTPFGGGSRRSCSRSSAADCSASSAWLAATAENSAGGEGAAPAGRPADGRLEVVAVVAAVGGCLA